MSSATRITTVIGRRVWDSRGRPTVEAEVRLAGGAGGRAIAPAGASTGSGEAVDKRDGGAAFGGHDVTQAVAAVNGPIAKALAGHDGTDQAGIDATLIGLDGTPNKAGLGGNATIAVSMAAAHAAAAAAGQPLWAHLAMGAKTTLPLPEIQIFGGGAHAAQRVDLQDYMVIATGADTFDQALDWTAEVYRAAGKLLAEAGLLQGVADEGGFWPAFDGNEAALSWLTRAIEAAGFRPGEQVGISLDIAASTFGQNGTYKLVTEGRTLDTGGMIDWLGAWMGRYPIIAIEDPLAEDDAAGFAAFTARYGAKAAIVADDFVVTNAERIAAAGRQRAGNTALIKPNQAGTLSETLAALKQARGQDWCSIVSARSGETEDVTIVHLATGWNAPMLKVGSFARSERMAKWNEGLRVGEALGSLALPPKSAFPWNA